MQVNGVKVAKSKKDVAEDIKVRLGVILAKVALVVEKRRFVREEVGNAVIVEFVSIKDAAEAMVKFQKGKVAGYKGCVRGQPPLALALTSRARGGRALGLGRADRTQAAEP